MRLPSGPVVLTLSIIAMKGERGTVEAWSKSDGSKMRVALAA